MVATTPSPAVFQSTPPARVFRVERSKAMHDHGPFDGKAERVLGGERKALAGVHHAADGDTADGAAHLNFFRICVKV
jgi:hypothetical protein